MVELLELGQFYSIPQIKVNIAGTGGTIETEIPMNLKIKAPSTPINVIDNVLHSISDVSNLSKLFLRSKKPYLKYSWGSHYELIRHFVLSIKNDTNSPVSIDEGIESVRLAQAIDKSVRIKKHVIL